MPKITTQPRAINKKTAKKKSEWPGYSILGSTILLATLALIVFGRVEGTWLTFAILAFGITLGAWLFRFGSRYAWVSLVCLFGSLAVCIVLGSTINSVAGIAWMGGFVAGTNFGAAWRMATMRKHLTVDSVRKEILAAIAEVRRVAQAEHDEPRSFTADYLDREFAKVSNRRSLRAAATDALALYGGWGSFSDVGTAESARAIGDLQKALHRGRFLFIRES